MTTSRWEQQLVEIAKFATDVVPDWSFIHVKIKVVSFNANMGRRHTTTEGYINRNELTNQQVQTDDLDFSPEDIIGSRSCPESDIEMADFNSFNFRHFCSESDIHNIYPIHMVAYPSVTDESVMDTSDSTNLSDTTDRWNQLFYTGSADDPIPVD